MPYLDQACISHDPFRVPAVLRSSQKVLRHPNRPVDQSQLRRRQTAGAQMAGNTNLTDYPRVILKPKEEGRLQKGHLWAFSNEVAQAPAGLAPGSVADLFPSSAKFL